jgi:hypothetical protein
MSTRVYRALVRGWFGDLDDATRRRLLAEAGEHDTLDAAFTAAGTLTYDTRLVAFSLRYEVRQAGDTDDPQAQVERDTLARAASELAAAGIPFRDLRVQARDMADVWRR